jgi:D-aspartate ligase
MHEWSEGEPGAVVVGGDYQGLGIVRSLGRHGIPVCVVDDEHSISRYSKYCKYWVKASGLRDNDEIVASMAALAERPEFSGWILYPTREELVAAFSRNRDLLSRSFRVPTPGWDSVQWAWDKRKTYQLACELGIPTPATYYLRGEELPEALERLTPPFAIKPAIKEHFLYAARAKAWRADSYEEARLLIKKAAALVGSAEVMVQELIPGGGQQQYSYCAFFRNGEAVGKLVARRLRQHPLQFGRASTYVETIKCPLLEELSERFLRAIGYYGLVELEYKLDPRDNHFKLLDVNARTWGYHTIGASAGVDFSYLLYADQAGLPVARCQGSEGIGWVRTTTDVLTAAMAMLDGQIGLRDYLHSIRKSKTDAVFSAADPLPGVADILLIPYLAMTRGF